jgi:short-subunit dehydrogenase
MGLFKSLDETSLDDICNVIDTDLMGPIYFTRAVLPVMKHQGKGHIITIASVAGRRGFPQLTTYCAAKYGVIGFSDSLRTELLKAGIPIHITVINPPATDTDFFNAAGYSSFKEDHPLVSLITPEEVAHTIVKAIENPSRWEIVITPRARFLNFLNKLFPKWIEYLNRKAAKAVNKH